MEERIKEIIKKQQTCIFFSPHLDDAILSAGGLLSALAGKTRIVVINVFTEATDDPSTLSARKYLHTLGYHSAVKLYEDRRTEDQQAWKTLGITPTNLGFVEALWRRKTDIVSGLFSKLLPEFGYVYPVYRLHITSRKIAQADRKTMDTITVKLKKLVSQEKHPVLFAPLGTGNHIDHCVVREVCKNAFGKQVIYWSDFPYNIREHTFGTAPEGYKKETFDYDVKKKLKLINCYKTQIGGLFGNNDIPEHTEIFFISIKK